MLRGTMRVHACKSEVINEWYCTCHVGRLEATSQLKHAAPLCGHKKTKQTT